MFQSATIIATQEQFAEKKSLQAFHRLIALSIEALELWRILSDHQFHSIVESANQVGYTA